MKGSGAAEKSCPCLFTAALSTGVIAGISTEICMSMFRSVIHNYRSMFSALLKVLLLVFMCVFFSFALVFPLWKFATAAPRLYSLCSALLLAAAAAYSIIIKVRRSVKEISNDKTSKKQNARTFLFHAVRIAVWSAAGISAVVFVMKGMRYAALICIAAAVLISGILSVGAKRP